MAADIYINDAGVARKAKEIWINDGGVARNIKEIWVNDGGVARQVFASAPTGQILLATYTYANPAAGTAQLQFNADGWVYATDDSTGVLHQQYKWLLSGSPSAVDVMVDNLSGTFTTGPASGVWTNLASSQLWSKSAGTGALTTVTGTFHLRNASTLVEFASNDITLVRDRT